MDARRADILVSVVHGLIIVGSIIAYVINPTGLTQGFLFGALVVYISHVWWKMARSSEWFAERLGEKVDDLTDTVEGVQEDVEKVQEDVEGVQEEVDSSEPPFDGVSGVKGREGIRRAERGK